jgi:pyruvate/2-oxoglutarate dehydrogenase complex dihydrolipoamide dehydrogenase (E3) component
MPPANPTAPYLAKETPARAPAHAARDDAGVRTGGATREADICIIGAGAGGLAIAAAATAVGQRVVMIEKNQLGGASLNYGCVPSKALLAAATRAHQMRTAQPFGITPVQPAIDYGAVRDHVYGVIRAIAPNDALERYTAMGVNVVQAAARFVDKATVEAGDVRIKARRFVIATGSSPVVPPIPGLDSVAFFTNETIFDNARKLERLVVVGGGATALELALAHLRLGSFVAVLAPETALADEDPELAAIALRALRAEGLDIREGVTVDRVDTARRGLRLSITNGGAGGTLDATHLLIAGERRPNVSDLNLAAAGIKAGPRGISVNAALRTTNRRVYAIGDVTGHSRQSHAATYHASVFLKRVLFRLRATEIPHLVPRVTFTDPEIAWVGLSEEEARGRHKRIRVLRWPYSENDRAQAERTTEGHIKVITDDAGLILGAGLVGAQASELIQVWALAVAQKLSIKAMTEWVAPYPTLSEINRRVALQSYAAAAGSPFVRWFVRFLGRFG